MKKVIQNVDVANGHTDVLGNPVVGTISSTCKMSIVDVDVARNGDIVTFPSHPHALDEGSPTNYRSHTVAVTGTGKCIISGQPCALEGDIVPVADEAGPNATMTASQFKFQSN